MDRDVDLGDRVAVWLVIAFGVIAFAGDVDGSGLVALAILLLLALVRVVVPKLLHARFGHIEIEGYLLPVLVTIRPTRLVLLALGTWSVLSGLASDVTLEGRLGMLLFGILLLLGAFLDGLVTYRALRTGDTARQLPDVAVQVKEISARLAALEVMLTEEGLVPNSAVRRPLVLLILVNLAALAAAALYSALFSVEQAPAQERLLVFAGIVLLLAFIGDRIRSLTFSKDSIALSVHDGEPEGGAVENPLTEPSAEELLKIANFERLPGHVDLAGRETVHASPIDADAAQTALLLQSGALDAYVVRASPAKAEPRKSVRSLKIVGRPRAEHKKIVDGFFRDR